MLRKSFSSAPKGFLADEADDDENYCADDQDRKNHGDKAKDELKYKPANNYRKK